jgi:hypothetical protein
VQPRAAGIASRRLNQKPGNGLCHDRQSGRAPDRRQRDPTQQDPHAGGKV